MIDRHVFLWVVVLTLVALELPLESFVRTLILPLSLS